MAGELKGGTRPPGSALALVWVAATLLGFAVAATTRIGPVVFSITARHGVHAGDLLAFTVAYAAALVITLRFSSR